MKYTRLQITLHWVMAALVVAMAGTGLAYSYELVGKEALRSHQISGQILIVLLALRIAARLLQPTTHQSAHALGERRLASGTHLALYALLIAFAVTGYVSASALGDAALLFPLDKAFARSDTGERFLDGHYALKWGLLVLLTLHLGGTLKHLLWDRDQTLSLMTTPRK